MRGRLLRCYRGAPRVRFEGDLLSTLTALHPSGPLKLPSLRTDAPFISWVDIPTLKDVIHSASKGSAPGRSGWTADLLKHYVMTRSVYRA
jgi:hypothetical protein